MTSNLLLRAIADNAIGTLPDKLNPAPWFMQLRRSADGLLTELRRRVFS